MKGQMYDCYLDPNACLYGTGAGAKPVHVMYEPTNKTLLVANNLFKNTDKLELAAKVYTTQGEEIPILSKYIQVQAGKCANVHQFSPLTNALSKKSGMFLYLSITDSASNTLVDENLYWLPDSSGNYSGLAKMAQTKVGITAKYKGDRVVEVTISNPPFSTLAFFNRISLVDAITKKRILPVFYSDNYFSVLPGTEKTITMEFTPQQGQPPVICIEGWNLAKQFIDIKN